MACYTYALHLGPDRYRCPARLLVRSGCLADIAASLGLSKIKTIQILVRTCAQLEVPLFDLYNVSLLGALGSSLHPAFHTIEDYRPALRFLILRYPKLRQILNDWSKTNRSH